MRIAHNIASLNTLNQYKNNNTKVNNSFEKLSSGKEINKAADNAAGLAISEKMRAQIRGLEQAEQNIKNGISLVQTAESGLSKIADPNLMRLRELAVQAANDTLTQEDREVIQKEVDQIKQGINNIANNTNFNGINLLNVPDVGLVEEVTYVGATEKVVTVEAGEIVTAGYIEVPNPPEPSNLTINAGFGTISGAQWPDMNIISPNGEEFGYSESMLSGSAEQENTSNNSSTKATYTGWGGGDEEFTFESPISGEWYIEIRHNGGTTSSTFDLTSNYLIYTQETTTTTTEIVETPPELNLQVGPKQGDGFTVDLSDVRTAALEINELAVDPIDEAEKAISLVDEAINKVSAERTKFGVYQNALEHINNNISNYKVNLTNSESQIRDLDMAKEITKLTNNQVVLQSSQAIFTKANQITQSILQFLK